MKALAILTITTAVLVATFSAASSKSTNQKEGLNLLADLMKEMKIMTAAKQLTPKYTPNTNKKPEDHKAEMSSQRRKFFHLINSQLSAIIQDEEEEALTDMLDGLAQDQADELTLITRYAGMGYNLLQANPEGDFYRGGDDPGIKKTRFIFKLTEKSGKKSFYNNKKVTVPDQVVFHGAETCTEKKNTHAYSGQKSYRKELSYNVDASASYSGIFEVRFSLSSGMQEAKKETELNKEVIMQHNKICNYGSVRYLLANARIGVKGFELSDNFKYAVKLLPSHYSESEYTRFLDNWGTDIIEEAQVGTHAITRSRATYNDVFKFLSTQTSNGASVGGGYIGFSGDISFNISTLDQRVTQNSKLGKKWTSFTLGTKSVPVPIFLKTISIETAFNDKLWSKKERKSIRKKKVHLKKALADYPKNKGAHISNDPMISVKIQWPDSQFSLPEPASGCPQGWSTGWRYQDTEDKRNKNSFSPTSINSYMKVKVDKNIKSYFCTKTKQTHRGFVWPKGTYCIARYGGECPNDFTPGFRRWDDEDKRNGNRKLGTLPDGKYDRNTEIRFCCRSDGRASNPAHLPTQHPFILYKYQRQCQKVTGMKSKELRVYWDDEDDRGNISVCSGEVPSGKCGRNQAILYCYYYQ